MDVDVPSFAYPVGIFLGVAICLGFVKCVSKRCMMRSGIAPLEGSDVLDGARVDPREIEWLKVYPTTARAPVKRKRMVETKDGDAAKGEVQEAPPQMVIFSGGVGVKHTGTATIDEEEASIPGTSDIKWAPNRSAFHAGRTEGIDQSDAWTLCANMPLGGGTGRPSRETRTLYFETHVTFLPESTDSDAEAARKLAKRTGAHYLLKLRECRFAVGFATKPFAPWRLPGEGLYSLALHSDGILRRPDALEAAEAEAKQTLDPEDPLGKPGVGYRLCGGIRRGDTVGAGYQWVKAGEPIAPDVPDVAEDDMMVFFFTLNGTRLRHVEALALHCDEAEVLARRADGDGCIKPTGEGTKLLAGGAAYPAIGCQGEARVKVSFIAPFEWTPDATHLVGKRRSSTADDDGASSQVSYGARWSAHSPGRHLENRTTSGSSSTAFDSGGASPSGSRWWAASPGRGLRATNLKRNSSSATSEDAKAAPLRDQRGLLAHLQTIGAIRGDESPSSRRFGGRHSSSTPKGRHTLRSRTTSSGAAGSPTSRGAHRSRSPIQRRRSANDADEEEVATTPSNRRRTESRGSAARAEKRRSKTDRELTRAARRRSEADVDDSVEEAKLVDALDLTGGLNRFEARFARVTRGKTLLSPMSGAAKPKITPLSASGRRGLTATSPSNRRRSAASADKRSSTGGKESRRGSSVT